MLLLVFVSCKKEDPPEDPLPEDYVNGILVLNEGLYQQNNSSISFYSHNTSSVTHQVFLGVNSRGLGDTANDLITFSQSGSVYFAVAVTGSSQVEVIQAKTLKSVGQINLSNGSIGRQPRRLTATNGKIYCANFDGTVSVIQISSLYEINAINVGENPDGIASQNGKVYVSNSGGLNAPNYDSTVTVIDASADTVLTNIATRINCTQMLSGANSDVYVISNGDYGAIAPAMLRIDATADTVSHEYPISITTWDILGDWIYYYDADLNAVYRYNTVSLTFENIPIIDGSGYTTPFKMKVTATNIFMVDANSYVNSSTVKCYDLSGVFLYEFTAGLNATDFVFNQ
jgi:hypothetical protein